MTTEIINRTQDEHLLNFKEAQQYLRCSRSTLYRLMWQGQLTGYKVGHIWKFYKQDLQACVKPVVGEESQEHSNE